MKYISTRGGTEPIGFSDAVLTGMARDGGLLLPAVIPDVRASLDEWRALDYAELASHVMRPFVDLDDETLFDTVERSYGGFDSSEVAPVVRLGTLYVQELFHGPTLAFKDIALQFLGNVFQHLLAARGSRLNILGATSGDTGSAAIHGVRGREGIRIFVMHPRNRISRVQELQMTSVLDHNVFNIAVEGTFDDCQAIMKEIFSDLDFKDRYSLGSVNSINWARVAAQIVYYFYGAFRVMEETGAGEVTFCVPTGNFGDIFAGFVAARMGLPVRRLVLATNENDILARFFNTGEYRKDTVRATLSPSMDIQVASNFERYLYYYVGRDAQMVRKFMEEFRQTGSLTVNPRRNGEIDPLFRALACDRDATLETIGRFHDNFGYVLDPHTATGVFAATRGESHDAPNICLATAHAAKFAEAVTEAVGPGVARHPIIDALEGKPTRCDILPASADAVRDYIRERVTEA